MTPSRHIALGLLFLAAVGILSYYTLFKTDFSLFEERQSMTAYAEDARGLRKGAPVLYAGVRWGKVDSVVPDLDRPREERVKIEISLDKEVVLFGDHVVRIESASVLGGVQLSIDPGTRDQGEIDTGQPLRAGSSPDVLAALGQIVDENRESLRNSIAGIEQVVASLNGSTGTFGRLLNDDATADNLSDAIVAIRGTFENAEALTDELRGGQGTIGKLIYDTKLYDDIETFVNGLDAFTVDARQLLADAKNGEGVLGAAIYDAEITAQVKDIISSIRSAAEKVDRGEGTIARLLNDGSIADDIQAAIQSFSNPDGTLGRLLNDGQIYENVESMTADLADAAAAIREQRGTLGILINDDGIASELDRALRVLTGALEEQREAAPIATFLSTVFLGF